MQIILKEDIIGLGYKNEIVTVKDGYGRNYLIPFGKAVIASASAKKVLAENLRQQAQKLAKIKEAAEAKAAKIAAIEPIVIATKVSATGTIYGSVNNLHIAEALREQGIEVERKIITLKDVKEVGSYVAKVHLHREVEVEVPFTVVAEGGEEPQQEAEEAAAPVEEAPAAEVAPAEEAAPVVEEEVKEEAPAAEPEEAPAAAEEAPAEPAQEEA
ncbi:MAG: 50S ribosomal protein L9 [Bacteroidaceae bacterium]|nr:50S ribosomal protein L9 [Bacteroidaceae bacterium]